MPTSRKRELPQAPAISTTSAALLSVLIGVNLLLLRDDLRLRNEIRDLDPGTVEALVGQEVRGFDTVSALNPGVPMSVKYGDDGRKKVFVFLSASCPFSRQQMPYWQELIAKLDQERFEVVGLVSEAEDVVALTRFLGAAGMDSFRIGTVSAETRRSYRLSGTPTTLVVSPIGKVEKAWSGKWGPSIQEDASQYFGFPLTAASGGDR